MGAGTLIAACFRGLLWLAARLNRRQAYRAARLLAPVLRLSEVSSVTRTNIEVCFPDLDPEAQDRLVAQSLVHMVLLFFELAALRYWPQEMLLAGTSVEGEAELKEALQTGNGVILLVPHLGAWELSVGVPCTRVGRVSGGTKRRRAASYTHHISQTQTLSHRHPLYLMQMQTLPHRHLLQLIVIHFHADTYSI